nr:uncharacterized mitochondrial protein AtMg00810-like [Tanacetum cinerariifolium]
MYNVDLKNIVSSRDLTCLFAKATLDESNLWHRRLGHINFKTMNKLVKGIENQLSLNVKIIKSDNGTALKNNDLNQLCGMKGIKREFSVPKTPQQNGIAERKNRTLIEAARTMLANSLLPIPFWAEAVNTACFMRPFGCFVTTLNTLDPLGKFDGKVDKGFLVGYSVSSKGFRVFNSRTRIVQETLHIDFLENKPNVVGSDPKWLFDIDTPTKTMNCQPVTAELEDITYSDDEDDVGAEADFNNLETTITVSPIPITRVHKDHHVTQIISNLSSATQTRSKTKVAKDQGGLSQINNDDLYTCMFACFLSQKEPKRVHQALKDPSWIQAIQEELLQFKMQKEEVYVCQPPGFEDPDYADKDPDGKDVDVHTYRSMIGSLMYLTSSRPDIMFAVYACACFQVTPKVSHFHAVKRIFKYLKGKPHLGLWYPKDSLFNLVTYSDSDYASASLDRKSTTRGCQFFGCRLISWQCKKQTVVNTSSTKAEYVAAASCCAQVLWIQNQLLDYGLNVTAVSSSFCCLVNDVPRLQALVNKKKVIITEATIRDALRLDDAEGIDCLPNKEIFTELARMGYEKPSTKLTFYKAIFSSQWKFLIHTIFQCMSAKRTSWNEFSSSMASAVICLSTCRKFNFSKYIFDSLMRNVDSPTKFYMVGKGCSGVETPLFEGMIVAPQAGEGAAEVNVNNVSVAGVVVECAASIAVDDVPAVVDEPSIQSPTPSTQPPPPSQDIPFTSQGGGIIANIDADKEITLQDVADIAKEVDADVEIEDSANVQGRQVESQAQIYQIDLEHADKVLSMQDDDIEPAEHQEVVEVVTTAKLITEVVTAASATITAAAPQLTTTAAPTLTIAPSATRRRNGVIEQDEAYAKELEAELNKNIDWDEVIDQVKRKEKEEIDVMRYQALKRKPQTEARARKNMTIYLRNMAGFKMDYFKGMTYDDIRPIFEKKFNSNVAFLEKTKEKMEEEDSKALKRIMQNHDDNVYTEATPLALKVPVVDYEIYIEKNKSYYKIKRVDGTRQLYLSFLSMLRNFDREDLEVLRQLVKKRFASSKPKNFSDDFLLTTLEAMFEKPDVQSQIWRNERSVHGQAKVKS